jgi:MoxR-like ATPase
LPSLSRDQVEAALTRYDETRPSEDGETWRTDERFVYFLSSGGKLYPIKEIAALAAGRQSTRGFNSQEARRRLSSLGYDIVERENASGGDESTGFWWVNQGSTFQQESQGSYVWAPQRSSNGRELGHHANVSLLRMGHRVIHYANGAIRAVGTVIEDAVDGPRPQGLPEGPWEDDGRYAGVEYRMLDAPVSLNAIPAEWRIAESNPFDSAGNVRQGYMFPLSRLFWEKLAPMVGETLTGRSLAPFLVGAQGSPLEADRIIARVNAAVEANRQDAQWWSYPLQPHHQEALAAHPFLYLYVSAPVSKITHRLHIVDSVTQAGPTGIESPWPDITQEEDRGKTRRSDAQDEIFKTWVLVDSVEELPEAWHVQQLETVDGGPAIPASLLNGFGLWRLKAMASSSQGRTWLFQANPNLFDLQGAIRDLDGFTWTTRQHAREIHAGDRAYLWQSGPNAGILATARISTEPNLQDNSDSKMFELVPGTFDKEEMRVTVEVEDVLEPPLTRAEIQENPKLASLQILRIAQQTNFPVTPEEAEELDRLIAPRIKAKPTLDDLVQATHLSFEELSEIEDLLKYRKQIVLEGPPGSGKTFVARLFARYFTGNPLDGAPDERVQVVQFHQSYGYEEFVQGIRPSTKDGVLHYDLEPGVFMTLCATAAKNPSKRFVLIIDEINRGNISRIFGELLYLLEYRDEAIHLGNSGDVATLFSIPSNVYLIGTMNTTDRSLSQIDYALRRRFYFYRLMPVVKGEAPVLASWLRTSTVPAADAERIVRLFVALNQRIVSELGEHFQLGHSYLMKDGIGRPEVLSQVWRRGVLPLLEEYFHNRRNLTEFMEEFTIERLERDGSDII